MTSGCLAGWPDQAGTAGCEALQLVRSDGWAQIGVVDRTTDLPGAHLLIGTLDAVASGTAGLALGVAAEGRLDAGQEADVVDGHFGGTQAVEVEIEILFVRHDVVDDDADALRQEVQGDGDAVPHCKALLPLP